MQALSDHRRLDGPLVARQSRGLMREGRINMNFVSAETIADAVT